MIGIIGSSRDPTTPGALNSPPTRDAISNITVRDLVVMLVSPEFGDRS